MAQVETTPGIIPQEVWSFYDPNKYFASSGNPEDALLWWLDEKRQDTTVLQSIGASASRQLVAIEQAHVGTITLANAAEHTWLGLKTPDIEQAVEIAQAYATTTAAFCLSAMLNVRKEYGESKLKDTHDITLAGAVLSANTHKGQTRVVGNRPYYSHPRDVALLLNASYTTHLLDSSDLSLPIYEFKGLLHDGFEDAIPREGGSFLAAANIITSPLVLSEVLRRVGVDQLTAQRTAIGMLALTKTVGFDGRMAYRPYIERFKEFAPEIPIKLADLQHNYRLDPKSPDLKDPEKNRKIYLDWQEYHDAQQELLYYYSNSDQITGDDWLKKQLFATKITKLKKSDLQEVSRKARWSQIPASELVAAYEDAA